MSCSIEPVSCVFKGYFRPENKLSLNGHHFIVRNQDELMSTMFGLRLTVREHCLNSKLSFKDCCYLFVYHADSRLNIDFLRTEMSIVAHRIHMKFVIVDPHDKLRIHSKEESFFSASSAFGGISELPQSAKVEIFTIPKMCGEILDVCIETEEKPLFEVEGFEEIRKLLEIEKKIIKLNADHVELVRTHFDHKSKALVIREKLAITHEFGKEKTKIKKKLDKIKMDYDLKWGRLKAVYRQRMGVTIDRLPNVV